jgi:hypothetical protein
MQRVHLTCGPFDGAILPGRSVWQETRRVQTWKHMSSDFLKLRLRAQEQEFSRQRDLNAYKTIRESLKSSGQLEVAMSMWHTFIEGQHTSSSAVGKRELCSSSLIQTTP